MVRNVACLAIARIAIGFAVVLGLGSQPAKASHSLAAENAQYLVKYYSQDLEVVRMSKREMLKRLRHPAIEKIEIDPRRYRLQATQKPHYGRSLLQTTQLSPFGAPRTVCVIDSGYDTNHPHLPGLERVTGTARSGAGHWDQPGDSHGTHVAGIIAGVDTHQPRGMQSSVGLNLHIVKVFADDQLWVYGSDLIAAAESCMAAGANIVSMSLGGANASSIEREVFAKAFSNGALLVAAAGNDGNQSCSYPACYESVISVAAVNDNKRLATFSQRNTQVELAAPGVNVWSTVLGGDTEPWSGTSMAAPVVSGAAALLWSLHPLCSNQSIRTALANSAEDLGAPGRDTGFGHGFIQLRKADRLLARTSCEQNNQ